MGSMPQSAEAGPLLDWLRGRRNACCRPAQPVANNCTTCGTAPQVAAVASNAAGLQPGQCMRTCQQTCSRTVVNYVPQTAYRTSWKQVPVTQYRPVTNSDPCTGCTVTCMRPCTTYTYQAQRVPYTTYRPVYRTETYRVPVTTITNDCATGGCPTGTCGTGGSVSGSATRTDNFAPNSAVTFGTPTISTQPATSFSAPSGGLSTGGGFQTGPTPAAPADLTPSLQGISPQGSSSRAPVIDQLTTQASYKPRRQPTRQTPTVASVTERISNSAARRQFAYSPIRFASQRTIAEDVRDAQDEAPKATYRGQFKPVKRTTTKVNSGWETVK